MKTPRRPVLPVLLVPLALSWAGILVASELNYRGIVCKQWAPFVVAALCACLGGWWVVKHRHPSTLLLCLLVTSLAFGSGNLYYAQVSYQVSQSESYQGTQVLTVIEDTRAYESSQGSEAIMQLDEDNQVRVRIYWNDTKLQLPKGSHIVVQASSSPLRDDQRWLFDKGIAATLSLSTIRNDGFSSDSWGRIDAFRYENTQIIQRLDGEGSALLSGVLLGYRETLQDTNVEQDFVTCGLTHLIAVSGSHLAVVAALLSWLLRRLPIGKAGEIIILLFVLTLYVMLTGLQPSAIRSALMAGVAGCSVFVERRGHAPSALAAAAVIMLCMHPPTAYSLGFWLSVFAVFGITVFANLISHLISTAAPRFALKKQRLSTEVKSELQSHTCEQDEGQTGRQPKGKEVSEQRDKSPGALSSALAVTVTATAATLPLAVPTFAVLSLVGPLANLIVAPLVSIVLSLGMIALILTPLIEPLGLLILNVSGWFSDLSVQLAAVLAQIPWASIPLSLPMEATMIISLTAAGLLYLSWPQPTARQVRIACIAPLVLVCALLLFMPSLTPARLTVMDVGQGDAILVQEQGKTVLIDTGASETALVHALARNRILSLDAVIITHLDSDHAAALKRLRGLVSVERVYFARGLLEHKANDEFILQAVGIVGPKGVRELSCGDLIELGESLSLTVLWPEKKAIEGSNEESICLLMQYDEDRDGIAEQQALLTGDAESSELQGILSTLPKLKAGIIKVGHHGSKDAVTSEQLIKLESSLALISVGANNRYGHPARETLDILEEAGLQIARTDERGDITCEFNGSTVRLSYATMIGDIH